MAFDAQALADRLVPEIRPSIVEIEGIATDMSERLTKLSDKVWEACKNAETEVQILDLFERMRSPLLEGLDQSARLRRANILNALKRRVLVKWRSEHTDSTSVRRVSMKQFFLSEAKAPFASLVHAQAHSPVVLQAIEFILLVIAECARDGTQLAKTAVEAQSKLKAVPIDKHGKLSPEVHDALRRVNNLLQRVK